MMDDIWDTTLHLAAGDLGAQAIAARIGMPVRGIRENFLDGRVPPLPSFSDVDQYVAVRAASIYAMGWASLEQATASLHQQLQLLLNPRLRQVIYWHDGDLFDTLILCHIAQVTRLCGRSQPYSQLVMKRYPAGHASPVIDDASRDAEEGMVLNDSTMATLTDVWQAFTSTDPQALYLCIRRLQQTDDAFFLELAAQLHDAITVGDDGLLGYERAILHAIAEYGGSGTPELMQELDRVAGPMAPLTDTMLYALCMRFRPNVHEPGPTSTVEHMIELLAHSERQAVPDRNQHYFGALRVGVHAR